MAKVYVLTSGEYSDYTIEAVKLDKDQAETLERIHPDWSVEEYDTDDIKILDKYRYYVSVADNGAVYANIPYFEHPNTPLNRPRYYKAFEWRPNGHWEVYVEAKDAEHAKKIGVDLIAKEKYRKLIDEAEG
jgi:hypothetical protein